MSEEGAAQLPAEADRPQQAEGQAGAEQQEQPQERAEEPAEAAAPAPEAAAEAPEAAAAAAPEAPEAKAAAAADEQKDDGNLSQRGTELEQQLVMMKEILEKVDEAGR